MVENLDKVYCIILPERVPGGICPEDCSGRPICAAAKSAVIHQNVSDATETIITKDSAIILSHKANIQELVKILMKDKPTPVCRKRVRRRSI
jgi:hypothetical protein